MNSHMTSISSNSGQIASKVRIGENTQISILKDIRSSEEWLKLHGLDNLKLTLEELIYKGKVSKPFPNESTGSYEQQLFFDSTEIAEFEYDIFNRLQLYAQRINLLLNGSQKFFGFLKGIRIGIAIDTSDSSCGPARLDRLKSALMYLTDEQLSKKKSLFVVPVATETKSLWKKPEQINCEKLNDIRMWISNLRPSGGFNLLKAIKLLAAADLDGMYVVLSTRPDQSFDILKQYIEEITAGTDRKLNFVVFDCDDPSLLDSAKDLAGVTNGSFHCFSFSDETTHQRSTEIQLIMEEINKGQKILKEIEKLRNDIFDKSFTVILNNISEQVQKISPSKFMPCPPFHDCPLNLKPTSKMQPTITQWMRKNGLRAKRLEIYQILSHNSYPYIEEFVSSIEKKVYSQVHEKAMVQFPWKDGTVRNVHVDLPELFEYQKSLSVAVEIYKDKVQQMIQSSYRLFGSIEEKSVVFVVDLSMMNFNYLIHIQHSLRLVMEEQLMGRRFFNLIGFGSALKFFSKEMVRITADNLQIAWKWVLGLECSGSRNLLSALRHIWENKASEKIGIYFLGSGVADQPMEVLLPFVEEISIDGGITLHVSLYAIDHQGITPSRYAGVKTTADCYRVLAHSTGGRFHWFDEKGVVESDDIILLTKEIGKAVEYSSQCSRLAEQVKLKYPKPEEEPNKAEAKKCRVYEDFRLMDTVTSAARKQLSDIRRNLTSRDSKYSRVKDVDTPGNVVRKIEKLHFPPKRDIHKPAQKKKSPRLISRTEKYRANPKLDQIPKFEALVTSSEWLGSYSLDELKLSFDEVLLRVGHRHKMDLIKITQTIAEAKHCDYSPVITVKGNPQHLDFLKGELEEYEKTVILVLRRYIKRMLWLLNDSREVFGCVAEKNSVFLVDTSGSMVTQMKTLRESLKALIWKQLRRENGKYTFVCFADGNKKWRPELTEFNDQNCHDAVLWCSSIDAIGNTNILENLEEAAKIKGVEAVYLITDKTYVTDSEELRQFLEQTSVKIHVISYYKNYKHSYGKLLISTLSQQTCGRFHVNTNVAGSRKILYGLLKDGYNDPDNPKLEIPESSDLQLLAEEIQKCRTFIFRSRELRNVDTNR